MCNVINNRNSELCVSCGLCCSGAMFEDVWVEPKEVESVQSAGMEVLTRGGHPFISLPCLSHRDGICMIYETRFFRCKAYKCKLLQNYENSQVSFELASSHILKSARLYGKLRERLGLKKNQPFWPSIREVWEQCPEGPDGAEFRRANATWLLEILALIQLLGKYFFDNGDERWLVLNAGINL